MTYKSKLIIALGLVYVIWGSTFMVTKVVLEFIPPLLLITIRFGLGGLFMLIYTLLIGERTSKIQILNASFIGILLSAIGNGALAIAIQHVPSGIVALFASASPIWVFLINFLWFERKKPSLSSFIGLILGFAGMVYLLNPSASLSSKIEVWPISVVMVGTLSWAYASLKAKELSLPKSSLQSAAIQMLAAGIFTSIFSFFLEENQLHSLQNIPSKAIWSMAYLIFIGSYIGYLAYLWLINNAPMEIASTYAYITPLVALLIGWLVLGEAITSRTIIASLIILTGVMLISLGNKKEHLD